MPGQDDADTPKRRKMTESWGGNLKWSWPRRVDEIAAGPHGQCIGVTDDLGAALTWEQLAQTSRGVAQALAAKGLQAAPSSVYQQFAGQRVLAPPPIAVMLPHEARSLAVILGVLRQGFPLLPLSIMHGDQRQLQERYEDAMSLFEPAAVISDSPLARRLLERQPRLSIIPVQALFMDGPLEAYEDVPTTLDHVLAYVFTSGTSGRSKCVCATNRMAWAEVQWYPQIFQKLDVSVNPCADRWRQDHEMGWWGAAYFGEVDVALAMSICITMMRPNDSSTDERGVTMMGALPSQLQNLWPDAKNIPKSLKVVFVWAERCDVELGEAWKRTGVRMADLLIASEYWLSLASCNLEVAHGSDGRSAHATRAVGHAAVSTLDDGLGVLQDTTGNEVTGLLAISGPQVSPGYVELNADGVAEVGSGEQSRETFKWVEGQWAVVPKDIVKRRPDQSFVMIGRAGGTIKVRGGVLMATNAVELQLQHGPVTAACITDPIHVQGGSCVVLELRPQSEWSFKHSLQRASFLRMPVLYVCDMPRNASTGKVQKAIVQAGLEKDLEVEQEQAQEVEATQAAQLTWYGDLAFPLLVACAAAQPLRLIELARALARGAALPALGHLAALLAEPLLRFCLVAWTHCATGHADFLSKRSTSLMQLAGLPLLLYVTLRAAPKKLRVGICSACILTAMVIAFAVGERHIKDTDHAVLGFVRRLYRWGGRLSFAALVGLLPRLLPFRASTECYILCLLCLIAAGRCLPASSKPVPILFHILQRTAAIMCSLCAAPSYMLCYPLGFALVLPSLVLAQFADQAWKRMKKYGKPLAHKPSTWPTAGPADHMSAVRVEPCWNGTLWVDTEEIAVADVNKAIDVTVSQDKVWAATAAGARAQELARQAGVDFHGTDSLKIARLSVLLKRHLQHASGCEPLELRELRDACSSEQIFVDLMDSRFVLSDNNVEGSTNNPLTPSNQSLWKSFLTWANGHIRVHREGATQAPWDCQVDMLMEWKGPAPLELPLLEAALEEVLRQHPLLCARPSPDDRVDSLLGNGSCDFSTLAASSWMLFASCWSRTLKWQSYSLRLVRWAVSHALWLCWPRTLLQVGGRANIRVKELAHESEGWAKNIADEVLDVLNKRSQDWWDPQAMFNFCVVNLRTESMSSRQFLYTSTSHKHTDGGAAAALIHAIRETYEALQQQQQQQKQQQQLDGGDVGCGAVLGGGSAIRETPVLKVQQERLWHYLEGRACPRGSIDAYFFDINNDSFYHDMGNSLGVVLTPRVCDVVRMAGLRMACSEEIAWLACMVCALLRLMPNERLIKILMVHNGRLGDAEGLVACTSQYVMLSLTFGAFDGHAGTPLADVASRVRYAVTAGNFTRPESCEQAHAKVNVGGMLGTDGHFHQLFRTHRPRKPGQSRAPHVLQIRMDNEGEAWSVKDFKLHKYWEAKLFWEALVCAARAFAQGRFDERISCN
mmetsp:Transcript_39749/g.78599  ORF Transcript_39749/g.78599 Transcript_39749/m.78599 type:complete len:1454 (-) Transcript_39749:105-4466(-)